MTRARAAWIVALAGAALVAPAAARARTAADSTRYAIAITSANKVGITVSNYGFFGNNFNSRSPSFEFPLGSGYEHMSRGGLWVGAIALGDTGLFTGVSTAVVDNAQGTSSQSDTEFSPAGTAIVERSRILNNRFYSPDAISDQDLDCEYSDLPGRLARGAQQERHTPLQILVHQKILSFSLRGADAFVVARFEIVNLGPPLRNLYAGLYAQLVSGDKNAYSTWPPSATSGPGTWYYHTYTEYDLARRLYGEHYCLGLPFPDGCNVAYCPPWAGVKLLATRPGALATHDVNFHMWSYSPGDTTRALDRQRYALMADTTHSDPASCVPGGQCSPIMLLSVGPFAEVDPGDTVTVDFAFVGGADHEALDASADFAQFAADIDYQLPSPPPSPRLHVETGERRVDLYWDDSPEYASDPTSPAPGGRDFEGYRLYFGSDRLEPPLVAQYDLPDTTGFNTGLDAVRLPTPLVIDGVSYPYHYRVSGLRDGFRYYGAITSYDTGDQRVQSLESGLSQNRFLAVPAPAPGERTGGVVVFPNPYRVEARWDQGRQVRDHYLWFVNLPPRCVLRIFTLAGDLVFERRFDGASYRGEGTKGLYDPSHDLDTPPPRLSGASFAWNLITNHDQAIATGLYLYSVENLDGGGYDRGKFLVVKSDREN